MTVHGLAWPKVAARAPRSIAVECVPITKARDPSAAEIASIAARLEPGLRRAVLAALEGQRDAVTLKALADAIKTGSVDAVLKALQNITGGGTLAGAEAALVQGATTAGSVTAGKIARITRTDFTFGVLNPRLIEWLQTYTFGLVRQINDGTREGIRTAVIAGMRAGESPIDTARQIKAIIGLTERQTRAVLNYRKELESFHLKRSAGAYGLGKPVDRVHGHQVFKPDEDGTPKDEVDRRRLRDFRYDGRLKAAMASRKPIDPKVIDKMVEAYAQKYRRHRSETIARTEALRTTNMGIQDAWRQAVDAGKVPEVQVRRRWIVAADERLCSICAPIPRLNPKRGVKFRQAFNTPSGPVMLPPVHPNCRCTVFVRMYEASQLADESA